MMVEWGQNIKKRRARQIRSIQQGQMSHSGYLFPKEWEMDEDQYYWKQPPFRKQHRSNKWMKKLTVQSILSFMLLVVTYLVFQDHSTLSLHTREFVTEVMNRPFNFQGVAVWYKQNIGANPTILPAFRPEEKKQTSLWIAPVKGKMILPFTEKRNGVVLRTSKGANVVAPASGQVVFAGEKEGIGRTVILQHEDGKHTWLSLLGSFEVKPGQWIEKGEKIGIAGLKSGQSLVYVALKQHDQFINPTEVIPFE